MMVLYSKMYKNVIHNQEFTLPSEKWFAFTHYTDLHMYTNFRLVTLFSFYYKLVHCHHWFSNIIFAKQEKKNHKKFCQNSRF